MNRVLLLRIILVTALFAGGCCRQEPFGFVRGSVEDETAIREIINQAEAAHYADDVDWENAFGGRFLGRQNVEQFVNEMVAPTLTSAEGSQRVTVRFLGSDLAIADTYWWMEGQAGPHQQRVGRNTYVLARNRGEWQIHVVRVADYQRDPVPTRTVDRENPWPSQALSPDELSLYEGTYESADTDIPLPIHIWVEDGVLRSETKTFGVIDLVPMGEHVFAAARYVNGALVEVYWPDERQVFQVEDGRTVGYRVMEGTTVLNSAKRIGPK